MDHTILLAQVLKLGIKTLPWLFNISVTPVCYAVFILQKSNHFLLYLCKHCYCFHLVLQDEQRHEEHRHSLPQKIKTNGRMFLTHSLIHIHSFQSTCKVMTHLLTKLNKSKKNAYIFYILAFGQYLKPIHFALYIFKVFKH